MNILITGISGRIGSHLAKNLVAQGYTVRGLVWPRDLRRERLTGLNVELCEGTITNKADVARAMKDIEVVYHLGAAFQGGGPFTHDEYFEINAGGTFNMLEAARERGDALSHFFYASSDALYQKYVRGGLTEPIHEDKMPVQPTGLYAVTKRLGEELCLGYERSFGTPVTVLRFALVMAGDEILQFAQFRLSHWLKVFANKQSDGGRKVFNRLQSLTGDEEKLLIARDEDGRSYKKHIVDVRDLVAGMVSGLGNKHVAGETFQLAAPEPFRWEIAVPHLADALKMSFVDVRLNDHPPTFYEFDLSKTRARLGFQPRHDIYSTIDSALALRK